VVPSIRPQDMSGRRSPTLLPNFTFTKSASPPVVPVDPDELHPSTNPSSPKHTTNTKVDGLHKLTNQLTVRIPQHPANGKTRQNLCQYTQHSGRPPLGCPDGLEVTQCCASEGDMQHTYVIPESRSELVRVQNAYNPCCTVTPASWGGAYAKR